MRRFIMKMHDNDSSSKVLAVCDEDILGKRFVDEANGLELNVSEHFYGTEKFDSDKVLSAVIASDNVNIVGNEIINLLLKEKVLDEDGVVSITGVKHAQIYRL